MNPDLNSRSVYVSGLPWETDEAELTEFMAVAGNVVSASVLRKSNKRSMGCAGARLIYQALNDEEIRGLFTSQTPEP